MWQRRRIDEHVVDRTPARMIENRPSVHGSRVAIRLAWLRQHVADVDLERLALFQGLRHTVDEEVRHDARVEAAGAEDHDVRLADRRKR